MITVATHCACFGYFYLDAVITFNEWIVAKPSYGACVGPRCSLRTACWHVSPGASPAHQTLMDPLLTMTSAAVMHPIVCARTLLCSVCCLCFSAVAFHRREFWAALPVGWGPAALSFSCSPFLVFVFWFLGGAGGLAVAGLPGLGGSLGIPRNLRNSKTIS